VGLIKSFPAGDASDGHLHLAGLATRSGDKLHLKAQTLRSLEFASHRQTHTYRFQGLTLGAAFKRCGSPVFTSCTQPPTTCR
jgi:hypothetical protein